VPFIRLASLVDDDENHGAGIIEFQLWISMAFRRLKEQLAHLLSPPSICLVAADVPNVVSFMTIL
jgi:hypothetical protein